MPFCRYVCSIWAKYSAPPGGKPKYSLSMTQLSQEWTDSSTHMYEPTWTAITGPPLLTWLGAVELMMERI